MKLAIIGGGSWGTALACVLAPRAESLRLWLHEADLAARIEATRENDIFLPGIPLPATVKVTADLAEALRDADTVLGVMPSRHVRAVYGRMRPLMEPDATIISATKGIEINSLLRMSEVIYEVLGPRRVAVLSGPTFAREIAAGEPAAIVISSEQLEVAQQVQANFSSPTFRLYCNPDPVGVEVGASLKNVIAIAAGVCHGLGLGKQHSGGADHARVGRNHPPGDGHGRTALDAVGPGRTRRFSLNLHWRFEPESTGRNEVSLRIPLAEILASTPMVAEGVETCEAAVALGQKFQVDLPITQQMYAVLHGRRTPLEALRDLMDRSLKSE